MPLWAHRRALCLMNLPSGALFLLKDHMDTMVFFLLYYLLLTRVQCLLISWAPVSFLIASTNSSLSGWLVEYLKVRVSFPASTLEAMGLVKLGRLSGEDLALYSWWRSWSTKIDVYGIIDFVAYVATYTKRATMLNNFGIPFYLLYLSWNIFFALILKCGGSHILGLGGRTEKARCDLLHLVKPELLHLG